MDAMIFGETNRPLFGAYNAPRGPDTRVAVLICPPWEREHLRTYKAMLALVDELTRNGCHTLRFDYAGSGNSPGGVEAMSIDGWTNDVVTAADEVVALSQCQRLILCGLRLGALLATNAVPKVNETTGITTELCLWEPLLSGKAYLERLYQTNETEWNAKNRYRPKQYRTDPTSQKSLLGYRINPEWVDQLGHLDYARSEQASRCIVATQKEDLQPAQLVQITAKSSILQLPGNARQWDDLNVARSHFLPGSTTITELGVGLLYANQPADPAA